MKPIRERHAALFVLSAGGAAAGFAALLVARLASGAPPDPPHWEVIATRSTGDDAPPIPCWSCEGARAWPIRFRTDLDLLAPLGKGGANAAVWFKDFAKPNGKRLAEATAALDRRVEGPSGFGKVFAPNDPILREAEPWCDQASMRFYPEILELKAYDTQIPNLLLPISLARSWVARGETEWNTEKAMADFRRAIRLGRLLRQEDILVKADLAGLACIRIGAEAIYRRAAKVDDHRLMLLAAIVVGETAPQRLLTSERLMQIDIAPCLGTNREGKTVLDLPEKKLDGLLEVATASPDLRFRGEAILGLNVVRFLGTAGQKEKALAILNRTAAEGPGPLARFATWSRDTAPTEELLAQIRKPVPGE